MVLQGADRGQRCAADVPRERIDHAGSFLGFGNPSRSISNIRNVREEQLHKGCSGKGTRLSIPDSLSESCFHLDPTLVPTNESRSVSVLCVGRWVQSRSVKTRVVPDIAHKTPTNLTVHRANRINLSFGPPSSQDVQYVSVSRIGRRANLQT